MPKYLLQASYTAEGARGILKDGGSNRRQAVEELLKSMGGMESSRFLLAFQPGHVFCGVPFRRKRRRF